MGTNPDGQDESEDLSKARGVATFEYNVGMVLVESDVEKAAAALGALRPGSRVLQNVENKGFTLDKQALLVARLKGHTWGVIYEAKMSDVGALTEADAKAISKAIGGRAMFYGNSDTAEALSYALFDKGHLAESMDTDEGYEVLDFKSPGLKTDAEEVEDAAEYVDALFRKLDAYEPGLNFSHIAGYLMTKPGDKIRLDGVAEAMERIDIVSMDARSVELCSQTPEGKKQAKRAKMLEGLFGGGRGPGDGEGDEE